MASLASCLVQSPQELLKQRLQTGPFSTLFPSTSRPFSTLFPSRRSQTRPNARARAHTRPGALYVNFSPTALSPQVPGPGRAGPDYDRAVRFSSSSSPHSPPPSYESFPGCLHETGQPSDTKLSTSASPQTGPVRAPARPLHEALVRSLPQTGPGPLHPSPHRRVPPARSPHQRKGQAPVGEHHKAVSWPFSRRSESQGSRLASHEPV